LASDPEWIVRLVIIGAYIAAALLGVAIGLIQERRGR
jgi:hypothetical protein